MNATYTQTPHGHLLAAIEGADRVGDKFTVYAGIPDLTVRPFAWRIVVGLRDSGQPELGIDDTVEAISEMMEGRLQEAGFSTPADPSKPLVYAGTGMSAAVINIHPTEDNGEALLLIATESLMGVVTPTGPLTYSYNFDGGIDRFEDTVADQAFARAATARYAFEYLRNSYLRSYGLFDPVVTPGP